MNDAIQAIRKQITTHVKHRTAPTVPYPRPVRERVVALARDRAHRGVSVGRTAHELGLRPATLYLWLSRTPAGRLRPVTVVEAQPPRDPWDRSGPVLVTSQGIRIEGLDAASLVAVLRGLA